MPQFDILTLFVQVFYSFAFLFALYLITLKLILVKVAEVIKMRKKLLQFQQKVSNKSNIDLSKRLYSEVIKYYK